MTKSVWQGAALAALLVSTGAAAQEVRQLDGGSAGGDVSVLRGAPSPAAPVAAAPGAGEERTAPVATAGDTLWLLDQEGNAVIGCELKRTSRVGRDRIACTRRPLAYLAP